MLIQKLNITLVIMFIICVFFFIFSPDIYLYFFPPKGVDTFNEGVLELILLVHLPSLMWGLVSGSLTNRQNLKLIILGSVMLIFILSIIGFNSFPHKQGLNLLLVMSLFHLIFVSIGWVVVLGVKGFLWLYKR